MLSAHEREKVIATIQSNFPIVNKWTQLRERHNATWSTMGICVSAFIAVACVPAFFWCGKIAIASSTSMGWGFIALIVAIVAVPSFFVFTGMSISAAIERRAIAKWFKDSKTKDDLRQLFKEKHSKEYVKRMLPQMSDQDIELLSKYPHAKEDFKRLINHEKNKRIKVSQDQQAREIENSFVGVQPLVNMEENVVTVQTPRSLNI